MVQLCLHQLISFLALIIPHLFISGVLSSATFTLVNKCNYTVWPGILSISGSAQPPTTGFVLQKNESRTIKTPSSWTGRFWGRTHCTFNSTTGNFSCLTGDCGSGKIECAGSGGVPPATLAEFGLGVSGNYDYYDLSLVDGYNLPMLIVPQGGTGVNCTNTGCISDLNEACPSEVKVTSTGGEGVGCKTPCEVFGTEEFCCSGAYRTVNTCRPTYYSGYFKKGCPRAYSYAYDDSTSLFTCVRARADAAVNYLITFCPSARDETTVTIASTVPYIPTDRINLDCGSMSEKISEDGREWTGDVLSTFTQSSTNASISFASNASEKDPSVAQVPYMTARIFKDSPFTYTFPLSPGPKFIRFYFYPATYSGLDKSKSFFSVRSGGYTLLSNFSAYLTMAVLEPPVSSLVKEFILHVSDNILNLTFSAISPESYGFVNGIEIVSVPENLYILGNSYPIPLIGQNTDYFISNDTALETLYRLNIGGNNVPVALDTGMFRSWFNDDNYIKSEDHGFMLDGVFSINYTSDTPPYTAPETVYNTSRTSIHNLTWHFPVDAGFHYLLRLHFCESQLEVTRINQRVFSIFINDQMAEENADVIAWTGGNGIPVFKDYIVLVPNPYDGLSKQKLWLTMDPSSFKHAPNSSDDVILNGLEIFKLSGSDNSLAGRNPEVTPLPQRILRKTRWLLKFGVVLFGVIAALSSLSYLVFRRWRRAGLTDTMLDPSGRTKLSTSFLPSDIRRFSLAEIKSGTSNFDDNLVIGVGGFGNVYKGCIDNGATTVAIKRLNVSSHQGIREFKTEIEMLSKLRHIHLVSLIGCCEDNGEMVLVYDYMANGTLRAHLCKQNNPLSWKRRLQICIGSARGLQYLHTSSKRKIIHRDVKSTNILLDERWVAKVSDFGLSKMGPTGVSHTHVSTVVKGTFGYLDPEYYRLQRLTDKSDVYSFGVVLFEVLSGKPAIILDIPEEPVNLAEWARCCYKTGALDEIIDLHVRDEIAPECLKKFADVAYSCVQEQGINRPSMSDVVWSLELALQLQEAAENMGANGDALETLENFTNLPFHLGEVASTEDNESLSGSIELVGSSRSSVSLVLK